MRVWSTIWSILKKITNTSLSVLRRLEILSTFSLPSVRTSISYNPTWACLCSHLETISGLVPRTSWWSRYRTYRTTTFGLACDPKLSSKLEGSIQRSKLEPGGQIHGDADTKTPSSTATDDGVKCNSFGWTTTWKVTMLENVDAGKASISYLKKHPKAADAIHVVCD